MFNHHSEHTTRLAINAEIDLTKIGNYSFGSQIFKHPNHTKGFGENNDQHSGLSHQVKAYIKRVPEMIDTGTAFIESRHHYVGVCSELHSDRSGEDPLDISISNSKKHSFSDRGNDTTTIKVSASADYPFVFISPNIDFELEIELFLNLSNKSIDVQVKGWHNDFPAYELIIADRVVYTHNPSDYGHTGPGFGNLTESRDFQRTHTIYLNDWDIRNLKEKSKFGW